MNHNHGKHYAMQGPDHSNGPNATDANGSSVRNPLRLVLEITLALFWIVFLRKTKAIYGCYLVVFTLAIFDVVRVQPMRLDERLTRKRKLVLRLLSGFLSGLITIANYMCVYTSTHIPFGRVCYGLLLLASGYVVWDIITTCAFVDSYRLDEWVGRHEQDGRRGGLRVFLATFAFLGAIYLLYLFLVAYPGNVTPDSFNQLNQILKGSYSNHHPYYSTQLIHLFFSLGMAAFGSVEAAIATYSVAQCLAVAATYAYAAETLWEAGCPRAFVAALVLSFGLVPYQFMYSVAMWKDLPFAMGCLLFLVALWRTAGDFSHPRANLVPLFLGTVLSVVMRNNGIYAFLVFLAAGVVFLARRRAFRRFALVAGVVAAGFALSVVMKYPLLRALGVPETEGVMNIAIPAQQIARIIVDDVDITDEERALIEAVAPANKIKEAYNPHHYKPIKRLIVSENIKQALKKKKTYALLWLRLGLAHPITYIKAWADQTAHYWNAGYDFQYGGIAINGYRISANKLGVAPAPKVQALAEFTKCLSAGMSYGPFLGLLICVGLHTWFLLVLFAVNALRGKGEWLLVVLPLAIILTLAIASPVLSSFRYAYAVFTTLGFVTAASFAPKQSNMEG